MPNRSRPHYFELPLATQGNLGSTDGHEFLAVSLKNRGSFENPQLLTRELLHKLLTRKIRRPRAKRATPDRDAETIATQARRKDRRSVARKALISGLSRTGVCRIMGETSLVGRLHAAGQVSAGA